MIKVLDWFIRKMGNESKEYMDNKYSEVENAKQRVETIIIDGIEYKKCCMNCSFSMVGWISTEYGVMDYNCTLFDKTIIGYDYMVCDRFEIDKLEHKKKLDYINNTIVVEQNLINANFRSY